MTSRKLSLLLVFLLCTCLLFTGCGKSEKTTVEQPGVAASKAASKASPKAVSFSAGEIAADSTELSIILQPGETELLGYLPQLQRADFSGSECVDEIYSWAKANPQVAVKYTVSLPDGSLLDNSTQSADLSAMSGEDIKLALTGLACLPELESLELGTQRTGLDWEHIGLLQQTLPEVKLSYVFNIYGMDLSLDSTQINLSHIPVDDEGAAVKAAMAYMPNLVYLDMDSCGVSNGAMADIRDAYPNVKVVWRVWFGEWDVYSVRTDVERILASSPSVAGEIYPGNCESLQYCTEVRYMDLGHNTSMTDISFISSMTKLEVAILAMADWADASPLANCTELEYLEIQTTKVSDLSPLAGLTKLKHLNIAYNPGVSDISPLYGLTQLERLWIGCINPVPAEQVAQMQAAAPNCEINVEVYEDPTGGRWRYVDYNELAYMFIYHDRYIQLRETFEDYASTAFSYSWNDPLY